MIGVDRKGKNVRSVRNRGVSSVVRTCVGGVLGTRRRVRVEEGRVTSHFGYMPSRVGCIVGAHFARRRNCTIRDGHNKNNCVHVVGIGVLSRTRLLSGLVTVMNRDVARGSTFTMARGLCDHKVVAGHRKGLVLSMLSGSLTPCANRRRREVQTLLLEGFLGDLHFR